MAIAPSTFRPPWLPAVPKREYDQHRGSARERGYDSRWEKARKAYLAKHPLCVCCLANGIPHGAELVDHIEPHKGDMARFWDSGNWQGLCRWCHENIKRAVEMAWLNGQAEPTLLRLDRQVSGWLHPARR
jgi:5-methylcytosine-specific restriction protein A